MPPVTIEKPTSSASLQQIATRVAFFITGFAVSSWAPLVPLVQTRIGLDERQLGSLLLCLGLGSVVAMPFTVGFAARFGCRITILAAAAIACASLPVMATAPNAFVLAAALLTFGAGVGTADVAMNIQAVIVEKASGRAMMSGFHGLYSVGGIAGASAVTGLLAANLSPLQSVLVVVVLAALLLAGVARGLLPYGSEEGSPAFALPRGRVLLIGALCFVMFLAEGSVLDWSGVLLNTVRGLKKSWAGLGYIAFSATMTIGRLSGDGIVQRLGPKRILLWGGLCSAAGFALAATVPAWPVSVLGFALVGVGASNVVPVLFSAAGKQTSMPSNLAVASVTTLGYAGLLIGPALLGFVAHASTLSVALFVVALLLVGVATSARTATAE